MIVAAEEGVIGTWDYYSYDYYYYYRVGRVAGTVGRREAPLHLQMAAILGGIPIHSNVVLVEEENVVVAVAVVVVVVVVVVE